MISFDEIHGEVLPAGDGPSHLVARVPGVVTVIRRDAAGGEAAAAELLELIRQAAAEAAPAPGRDLARRLTEWVVRTRAVPGFGTIAATDDGIAVFLHGDVTVAELPAPGTAGAPAAEPLHLSGRTAAFTVDRLLPRPAGPIVLTAGDPDRRPADPSIGMPGWSGLVQGLVPGVGIVLGAPATTPAAAPAPGRHASRSVPAPTAEPEATQEQPAARPSREPTAEHPVPDRAAEPVPVAEPPRPPLPRADARKFVSTPLGPPATPPAPPSPPPSSPPPSSPPPSSPPPSPPSSAPSSPPPAPPSDEPVKLRPPRLSEQIFGAHQHETPRPPLPVPGAGGAAKPAPPRPGAAGPAHVLVKGFRCSRNHHNDPRVSFCSVCGIRMDQRTGILVDGRRPPLGLLVLDIGSTFVLDDNYLLGRNPEVDEAVISSQLRPIRLDDDSGTLSRVHAEIRLEGWDVLLLDRGSANGTHVAAPGQSGWNRLAPHRPIVLTPGTHVRIGRRVFTFESAHARL